jgi:hypothetical protein
MKDIEVHVGLLCVIQDANCLAARGKVVAPISSRSAGPRKYVIQLDDGRTVERTARQLRRPETEKTYTLTLAENEMARVIHALRQEEHALSEADEAHASTLAEASKSLADRLCALLKPERDPLAHVPTDERWREEAQHHS